MLHLDKIMLAFMFAAMGMVAGVVIETVRRKRPTIELEGTSHAMASDMHGCSMLLAHTLMTLSVSLQALGAFEFLYYNSRRFSTGTSIGLYWFAAGLGFVLSAFLYLACLGLSSLFQYGADKYKPRLLVGHITALILIIINTVLFWVVRCWWLHEERET